MRRLALLPLLAAGMVAFGCGGAVASTDDDVPDLGPSAQGGGQANGSGNGGTAAAAPFVIDELLVEYKPSATASGKSRARGKIKASSVETIHTPPMKALGKGELEVVRLPPGQSVQNAINALAGDPDVVTAEPNWVYQHTAVSNDSYYTNGSLWGMYGPATLPATPGMPANAFGSGAAVAWAGEAGTDCGGAYVGIIDEGYMTSHEDLVANVGTNPGETANGVDDDGNGYTDDVNGWDFDANNKTIFDGVDDDHGTHVAGTIAGHGGNGKGVAGVCWSGVRLLSAKFLGKRGGTTANAIKAVDYFTDLKTRHNLNLVATNNSWGGGGFSTGLRDAIARANGANILFVAAAGNETNNNDAKLSYPGSYDVPNVIAVAALTSTGALASYSNWGATTVDIGAPGSAIWSTVPKAVKGVVVSSYASFNGTSMATPHVTGAVALYASRHPGSDAATIKQAILGSAVATPSLAGKCITGGRLDVSTF